MTEGISVAKFIEFILLGAVGGVASGLLGIGGAVVIVPVLVFIFGWSQHMAQGTTLAMLLPPIGILAVLRYYNAGNIDLKVAGLLCVGFLFGGWLGAVIANQLSGEMLRKVFGVFLLLIGLKMILGK
jgi:uncharacterized membrane protein YfcA